MSTAKRHHYVPRFLLRQWARRDIHGQMKILAHYWDDRRDQMRIFPGGENQFCYREDLFTLNGNALGVDALERVFFKSIDDLGAAAHRKLVQSGVGHLTNDERSDFIRLILSMDARRPSTVDKLVSEGTRHFRNGLDQDPAILAEFERLGLGVSPSEYWEQVQGRSLADQSKLLLQSLTNNPMAGDKLAKFHWLVRELEADEGAFVLSDRPLVRLHGIDDPNTLWMMTLTPNAALFMTPRGDALSAIAQRSSKSIRNLTNSDSAMQADRYVFSVVPEGKWLAKRLKHRADKPDSVELLDAYRSRYDDPTE